jgi:Fic family protein
MDISRFSSLAPGSLVRISEGGHAFVPALLPPSEKVVTDDIVLGLEEATTELGRLDGLAANLPDPELLLGPFLRREAVLSSRIEGTQTTYSDLVLFEAEADAPKSDTREVWDYTQALKYGVRRLQDIPIGRQLILEVHAKLMASTDKKNTLAGQFRDRQVYIAPSGLSITDARYVPPPAYEIAGLFANLADYLEHPDKIPLLVRLAITHYQFEAIHPFLDGNGRLGRLLIVMMLCKERRLAAPMLYLSAYFERRRAQYNDLMLNVSQNAEWEPWVLFFLQGVATQARDAIKRTKQLHTLRDSYRSRFKTARTPTSVLTIVDYLFQTPVVTIPRAKKLLGFSWQAASENVQKLVDANILRRLDLSSRIQYFVAPEIIEILDRAEAVPDAQGEPKGTLEQVVTQEVS